MITHSINTVDGKLYDTNDNSKDFTITVDSDWNNFNIINPEKINFKKEEHLFENVKYNSAFWKTPPHQ
nr:hypothetical protein [uncultured Flavobacterium sp.]